MNLSRYSNPSRCFRQRWIALISSILLAVCLPTAQALALEGPGNIQIHGFISQGFVLTSDNNFCGDSDDHGAFDFRELGINGSWRLLPSLQLSGQILYRSAGDISDDDVQVDYGFLDYRCLDRDAGQWGFRLGRVKTPYGLYNETRDVAITRPSIFLPQSIYFERTRDLAISADGVCLYGEHRADYGNLFLQAGAGRARMKGRELEGLALGRDFPGSLDDDTSYYGRLTYEKGEGRLRLALTWAQLNIDYEPSEPFPEDLRAGSIRFEPFIVSAQLNQENWSLTAEYASRPFEYRHFGYPLPDRTITGESYYLQGIYKFSNNWEGMIRYDIFYSNRDDRHGRKFERPGRPDYSFFAKDLTLGLRWDINRSLMLRSEYHYVNGTAWLSSEDNPDPSKTRQYWDLFAVLMAYSF